MQLLTSQRAKDINVPGLRVATRGPNRPAGARRSIPIDGYHQYGADGDLQLVRLRRHRPDIHRRQCPVGVPTVQPSQSAQYSSTWIGIDGYNDGSLIQTGTAQGTSDGATGYYDWWEIITPSDQAPAMEIAAVTPGDHMLASVQEVTSGTWTIAITDLTSGNVFSQQFSYSGAGGSAEWIEEAPDGRNRASRRWPTSVLPRSRIWQTPTRVRVRLPKRLSR